MKKTFYLAVLTSLLALPVTAEVFDFTNVSHDFVPSTGGTSSTESPFTHADGRWFVEGAEAGTGSYTSSILTSPEVTVTGETRVRLRHSYDFELDWDSAHLLVSVNGGADQVGGVDIGAFSEGGYNRTLPDQGTNPRKNSPVWTGDSSGTFLSVLDLGDFPEATTLQVKLVATWDAATTAPSPNWEVFAVEIVSGIEPIPPQTWLVDSNVTNPAADFNDLQLAIDSANPGDTIMLMPAGTSYGDATINKSLTVVGSGFGGAELFGPARDLSSMVEDIFLETGVAGVTIMGLIIEETIVLRHNSPSAAPTRDILIYRNLFLEGDSANSSILLSRSETGSRIALINLFVINNWIRDPIDLDDSYCSVQGAYFYNNRIGDHVYLGNTSASDVVYATVANNVLPSTWQDIELELGSFLNNIVHRAPSSESDAGWMNGGSAVVENNVFVGSAWPFPSSSSRSWDLDTAKNILAKQMTNVVQWTTGPWWRYYVLVPDSPAIGYGHDGTDAGLFGGPHPWDIEQMPPIPFITHLTAPAVVSPGDGLPVTVEVMSNE